MTHNTESDAGLTTAEREALYPIVRKSVGAYMVIEKVIRARMAQAWDEAHELVCDCFRCGHRNPYAPGADQ